MGFCVPSVFLGCVDVCVLCAQLTGCHFGNPGCVSLCCNLLVSGKIKLGRSCGNAKATYSVWESLICEDRPAFGAIKPIKGNVSAEKAEVGSV